MANTKVQNSILATSYRIVGLGLLLNGFRLTYHCEVLAPLFENNGGRSHFLTMWGLFFSTLTFMLKSLSPLFPSGSTLRNVSKLSLAIALPLESVITTLYWPIILLVPQMMVDPDLGEIAIPLSVDMALHLYPALLLWTEYFLFSERLSNPSNGKIKLAEGIQLRPLTLNVLISAAYVSRVELFCKLNSNIPLPYPFLNNYSFAIRLPIYIASAALSYTSFCLAECLHDCFVKV